MRLFHVFAESAIQAVTYYRLRLRHARTCALFHDDVPHRCTCKRRRR